MIAKRSSLGLLAFRKAGRAADAKKGVVALLSQIVLVQEPDFVLGGLKVCPSRREIVAGAHREVLQPRIMQVLVALARRRGEVVSRDELMAACWSGFSVSDDAIHRCIARLRRLSEAHGGFNLETVPRVSYQLSEKASADQIVLARVGPRARIMAALVGGSALLIAAGFLAGRF